MLLIYLQDANLMNARIAILHYAKNHSSIQVITSAILWIRISSNLLNYNCGHEGSRDFYYCVKALKAVRLHWIGSQVSGLLSRAIYHDTEVRD